MFLFLSGASQGLPMRRYAVSSGSRSTPGQTFGRQATDAAWSRSRTSDSVPSPGARPRRVVRVQIDPLVFEALPQSLDEHIVAPTPFPVHADLNAVVCQEPHELQAGDRY